MYIQQKNEHSDHIETSEILKSHIIMFLIFLISNFLSLIY